MLHFERKRGRTKADQEPLAHQIRVKSEISVVRNTSDDPPKSGQMITAIKGDYVSNHEPRPSLDSQKPEIDNDASGMSDLVHFLNTKEPPPSNWVSQNEPANTPAGKESTSSFFKAFRRNSKPTKPKSNSSDKDKLLHLPDTAVAQKTISGFWHIAISIPKEHDYREKFNEGGRPVKKRSVPRIPLLDISQIEDQPPQLQLDMGFNSAEVDIDEVLREVKARRNASSWTIRPIQKPSPGGKKAESKVDERRRLDTPTPLSNLSLSSAAIASPKQHARASSKLRDGKPKSLYDDDRIFFDRNEQLASLQAPPRVSSKHRSGHHQHISTMLKDFDPSLSKKSSAKWSEQSAKTKSSQKSLTSARSEESSIYELSKATVVNAEVARGYCALPSPSDPNVKTYRPAAPVVPRRLSSLPELSHEGLGSFPSKSTLAANDKENTRSSRKKAETKGPKDKGSKLSSVIIPHDTSEGIPKTYSQRNHTMAQAERENIDSANIRPNSDDAELSPLSQASQQLSFSDEASASTAVDAHSPRSSQALSRVMTANSDLRSSIMLVADIVPDDIETNISGDYIDAKLNQTEGNQIYSKKSTTSRNLEDSSVRPRTAHSYTASTIQDTQTSISSPPSYSTRHSFHGLASMKRAAEPSVAPSELNSPEPSMNERRHTQQKRSSVLKQQALEARIRKVENQNAVLLQTLSAVAEMGASFKELLRQQRHLGRGPSISSTVNLMSIEDIAADAALDDLEEIPRADLRTRSSQFP